MTGCRDFEDESPREDYVPLTFYLQTAGHQTRAYVGDLTGTDLENAINTVKVWLFDGETCVSYSETIDSDNKVTMSVPLSVVSKGSVDVYIIANAGDGLDGDTGLGNLTTALLTSTSFTATTPTTAVPTEGLPMSRIYKECPINATALPATLPDITITRAVSKIHFAFGMYDGDFGEIVGISLDGGQIADKEYIFPVNPSATANAADYTDPYLGDLKSNIVANSYETAGLLLGTTDGGTDGTSILIANADMPTTETDDNPANYMWINWIATTTHSSLSNQDKATKYYSDLNNKKLITHTVYLRESDQKLTGKIYYRMSSDEDPKSVTFAMDAESEVQDFARNHVWIVYSYFEGGKLYVKPTVADWIDAPELEYTLKMSTSMRLFDSWLYRYDTDGDYTDYTKWATSHMAVSSGRVETPVAPETVAGRPLRSPQIQLVTTGVADASVANSGTFELIVDNSDFEIVRANKNETGVVTSYDTSTDGKLTIAAGDNVYTYFYIVPKEGVTPANPVAKVSLIYNDPVLGPQRVTFNNNALPGYSDDSSEIWAYYVAPEDYKYIVDVVDEVEKPRYLKMYYQNATLPLVPTAVQN